MKIAICFSGQVRYAVESFKNIKHFIGDLWDDCSFFCYTWDSNDIKSYSDINGIATNECYRSENLDLNYFEEVKKLYPFKKVVVADQDLEGQKFFKLCKNDFTFKKYWHPMFYSWVESFKLAHEYENELSFNFDYVVKLRFDAIYSLDMSLREMVKSVNPTTFMVDDLIQMPDKSYSPCDVLYIGDSNTSKRCVDWLYTSANLSINEIEEHNWYNLHVTLRRYLTDVCKIDLKAYNITPFRSNQSIYRYEAKRLGLDSVDDILKCFVIDWVLYIAPAAFKFENYNYLTDEEIVKLGKVVIERAGKLTFHFDHYKHLFDLTP